MGDLAAIRQATLRGAGFRRAGAVLGVGFFGREGWAGVLAAHDLCRPEDPGRRSCDFARGCCLGWEPALEARLADLLAAGGVQCGVLFRVPNLAILHLPSGMAAVLEYLQPMLVGLLAWMILGESLSLAKIVGLVLGFSGIVAVSSGSIFGNISPAGVAFGASSAFSWALGTVFFKRYEARISTMWAVAIPFVLGGTVLTLFGFARESWSEV